MLYCLLGKLLVGPGVDLKLKRAIRQKGNALIVAAFFSPPVSIDNPSRKYANKKPVISASKLLERHCVRAIENKR
jgi:hypothetical protein